MGNKKVGLALGSGGARGLLHIGVLEVLEEEGVEVDFIAGTSSGACVGAMLAYEMSAQEMKDRILNTKWQAFKSLIDFSLTGGVLKGRKLEELLGQWIGVDDFEELKKPFACVAADLLSGQEVVIQDGDLLKAIRASMAVPGVFAPVKYQDELLVDGGIINPVPDNIVKKMGAEVVIAVNLDYKKVGTIEESDFKWAPNILKRSFDIARHHLAVHNLRDADIVLNPEFKEADIVGIRAYFKKERVSEYIEMGRKLMRDQMDDLRKLL